METVQRSVVLEASRGEVWEAVTDAGQLSQWFGARVDVEARPGAQGRFVGDDGEVREVMVIAVEPQRQFTFQWWPVAGRAAGAPTTTRVTMELEDCDGATRLTVTERGVVRPGLTGGGFARAMAGAVA